MAYTNPFHIANGLILDFTIDAGDADNDKFLAFDTDGSITQLSSIKASRISGGGNLTESTSSVLTISGTGILLGNGTIQVKQAGTSQAGYLSSTDWNTFNNKLSSTLASAYVFVGNGAAAATGVPFTGDISITNTGLTAIVANTIVNADINSSAAIAFSKMATLSASLVTASDGSGYITTVTGFTTTIAGYLTTLTSNVQDQLTAKDSQVVGYNISTTLDNPSTSENGYAIIWDNSNNRFTLGPVGAGGSVTGPGSSTDNAIVRWDSTGGTSIQNSQVIIDDSGNITAVTTISVGQSGIHILDTDDSHDLILAVGSNLTADRTLTLTTGDTPRTITLSGNPTLADWFDQSLKTSASVVFADVTVSNAGGLHILDSDSTHDLIITTSSNLTADRTLTLVPGDLPRTLTIDASGTIYVTGGTDVALADGGTGASLADPGADRVMFWDDSAGQVTWLTMGTNLTITGTTLDASGGGGGVSDGTFGDITVTGVGTVWTVNTNINKSWTGTHSFRDNNFTLLDNLDTTKILAFQLSGITTATTRTLTVPNASGTIALTSDLSSYVQSVTGTANRITSTGGQNPVIDISASYVGQASITTLGTIATGTWNGTSISTTYTDAKVKTVTGTSSRLDIGGTATDPTFNISTSYVGQTSITTLGTIIAGTWNSTSIGVIYGGTGLATIAAKSIWVANSANTITTVTPGAGQSIRINAGNTAWEAYTPSGITNSASNNEMMKSNGTNAIGSGLFSTTNGDLSLGDSSTSGTTRTLTSNGSGQTIAISISPKLASSADGGDLILSGGTGAGLTFKGGDLRLYPGGGNSSAVKGNIQISGSGLYTTWQSMEGGIFIGDVITAPTGNPTSGYFSWSSPEPEGSNLKTITSDGHYGKLVLQKKITIAGGATLRSIGSSPQTIIAAPGANKYLNIISITLSYKFLTAAYDFAATEHPIFKFTGGTGKFLLLYSTMNSGSDFIRTLNNNNNLSDKSMDLITNTAFVLTTDDGGNATTGSGDIDVVVYYTVENTNT